MTPGDEGGAGNGPPQTRMWGGRFGEEPDPGMIAFTRSAHFDVRLAHDDCAVLAAHARALAGAGVLTDDEARAVANELEAIAPGIRDGEIRVGEAEEDIHTTVERALLERLPDIAPKIRAGLSRNDRVVTALRRWLKREGAAVAAGALGLIDALIGQALDHQNSSMPGYTHLQRAQPVTLGHHLLAHAFALVRDVERLTQALARADESPLGAGALAGSTLPLDAVASARALGFAKAMDNSLDAVSARDFVAEFLAAAAILGVHLSRIGEEIVLWTTEEFGFATLDDAWATGSSLMPHKKNPDVAELARGKSGRLIGNLTGLLVALKGLPLAYNRDLQEDKEPLFDTIDTLRSMLPALKGVIQTLRFEGRALSQAATRGAMMATDLAERLVRDGVPFREAHERVGRIVAKAEQEKVPLLDVAKREEPKLVADLLEIEEALAKTIGLEEGSAPGWMPGARSAPGPSPESLEAQLDAIRTRTRRAREGLERL